MASRLDDLCGASIPAAALPALVGIRCRPGVRVLLREDRAWLRWEPGDEPVARCLLPLAGAEVYSQREGLWYRLGRRLPSFDLPWDQVTRPLHQVLLPAPVQPEFSRRADFSRVRLRLVRDGRPRRTAALLCELTELRQWAETATTAALGAVRAARAGAQVLLLGDRLPACPSGVRFWGRRVLVPLGLRPLPDLPESALLQACGAREGEQLLVREVGAEVLLEEAFAPLTRAGVRLAGGAS
jgi:hypothetical protein